MSVWVSYLGNLFFGVLGWVGLGEIGEWIVIYGRCMGSWPLFKQLLGSPIFTNVLGSNVICICILIDLLNKLKLNCITG